MSKIDHWGPCAFTVQNDGEAAFCVTIKGRDRWALETLMAAGTKGCTPIDNPAPRWSAYIFNLRALGIQIETINEPHKGPFAGNHARYVLRSLVTRAGAVS